MDYRGLDLKIPIEQNNYNEQSNFVLKMINGMVQNAFDKDDKYIILKTNIRGSFPLSNINKLAAPLIESWADNVFSDVCKISNNHFSLIHVEAGMKRTDLADVVLQFRKNDNSSSFYSSANVDVKSTTDTIKNSGKGPNITSFAKIRTSYVEDPDFIFVILSLRYHPYSKTDPKTNLATGIIELYSFHSYDFKYLSSNDFSINPALGTGQIQIKDIHYVNTTIRSTWELLQLLDDKYINSKKHSFKTWKQEAISNKWIK